ncbi:MAG: DUF3463 domain-containing protein, partial [Candidatus Saccharimonadales bacterium]
CTPWGNPTYNLFGWQKPCSLLGEGYAATFQELLDTTDWPAYGRRSGNPKCRDCMVHCGYEPTAVRETFGSLSGFFKTAWLTTLGPQRVSEAQLAAAAPVRAARVDDPSTPRSPVYELPVLTNRF